MNAAERARSRAAEFESDPSAPLYEKLGANKTERVTIVNRGKRAHSYYVEVAPQGKSVYQDRAYTLRVG